MARNDLGRRAICGWCDLEIERHPPIWLDRGGNSHCNLPGQPLHLAAGENVWTLLGETAKRHVRAICRDEVTRSNIIGIRKALNANYRRGRGYSVSVTAPNVCREEIEQIETAIAERLPVIIGELDESGRKLLRSKRYAKRLAPVAEIIADLVRFRLIGFEDIGDGNHVPLYRAYDSRGRHFTFRNVAWQSGGNGPELLAIDKKGLGNED